MNWKFSADRPVYQQIIQIMEDNIFSGEFPAGCKIPSVRELAAAARVNPNTMQHALQDLEQQGLLVTAGTIGRFVTDNIKIIELAKAKRIQDLAAEYAAKLKCLGVSADQATLFLQQAYNRKD